MRTSIVLAFFFAAATAHAQRGPGSCLVFDGIDDYVEVPHATALNVYPLTLTFWIRTTNNSPGHFGIVGKYVSGSGVGYQVLLKDGRVRAWYYRDNLNYIQNATFDGIDGGLIADGQWHHVAFTVDASGGRLFRDGILWTSVSWTGAPGPPATLNPLLFFAYGGATTAGTLDEVTLWNRRLTTFEIISGKNLTLAGNETGLIGYWRIDIEGNLSTVFDSAGNHDGLRQPGPFGATWTSSTAPLDPPRPEVLAATSITTTSAVLSGDLYPFAHGLPWGAWFEYGTSTNYGNSTVVQNGNGPTVTRVNAQTFGLQPSTTYHYRFVGTNANGRSNGPDRTFTTLTPTEITQAPSSQTVPARTDVTFSVSAAGSPSLTYQWFEGGSLLSGATGTTLTRTDVRYNSTFTVRVAGPGGTETSAPAQLTVVYQPGMEFLPPAGADPTNRSFTWIPAVAASSNNFRLSAGNPPVSTNIAITWRDTNNAAIVVSAFVQNIPATNRELAQVISPPPGADLSQLPPTGPTRQPETNTYWHPFRKRLYMVAPGPATNIWKHTNGSDIKVVTIGIWPTSETRYQRHVAGTPPVFLNTNSGAPWSARLMYQEPGTGIDSLDVNSFGRFSATGTGRSLLLQFPGGPTADTSDVYFQLVRTVSGNNVSEQSSTNAVIGTNITDTLGFHNAALGQPYLLNALSRYCALSNYHDRATRAGPIIPVNRDNPAISTDDLVLVAYQMGTNVDGFTGAAVGTTFAWPYKPIRYNCQWPVGTSTIAVGSLSGSGEIDGSIYRSWNLYVQNDLTQPGFNPNDEHALRRSYGAGEAVFALRNDLGDLATSEPYVLLTYRDSGNTPRVKVFRVVDGPLVYDATAGPPLQPPMPMSKMKLAQESYGVSGPHWRDRKMEFHAKAAGDDGGPTNIVLRFFYPAQAGFYFPQFYTNFFPASVPATNLPPEGSIFPWLDWRAGTPGTPSDVTFIVQWPADVPLLRVGESLVKSKFDLPDLNDQTSAEILYQQAQALGTGDSVKLIDPTDTVSVSNVLALPGDVTTVNQAGEIYFPTLPPHLRPRFWYDPARQTLNFKGLVVEPPAGEYYLLLNVITDRDKEVLFALSNDATFDGHVNALATKAASVIEIQPETRFDKLALTAGLATGEGYVTLAFGNSTNIAMTPEAEGVVLSIIRVECPLYRGELKVIESEGPFDEKLTLRHSGDFAGRPEDYRFEWKTLPPTPEGTAPPIIDPEASNWGPPPEPANGIGAVDITIQGAGLFTLSDNYFICRYRPRAPGHVCGGSPSEWTTPQLAPGWIKRVIGRINPFTQRAEGGGLEGAEDQFGAFNKPVNTIVRMISQAGPRFEGAVPFNADAVDEFGLIEIYETVLKRGIDLSISGSPSVNYGPANDALLLAAGRLSDLYMLLGNEAYADASDPTIAYGTDGVYGAEASSIHCFQNQVGSLLEEELALFRGRDDRLQPGTQTPPFYNRLIWNYTQGEGEVAYAANYDIRDEENGVVDGVFDEADAKRFYPQGHGDAWGHYLTAIKGYYHLLHNTNFTWVPRIEAVLVGGVPVSVDYLDERKFAKAAAARARAGSEIVNLTYRNAYVEDPSGQWQGYRDVDEDRAWGLSEWGSRTGQGAYFDWVVGNALLPPTSTNTGIKKIDRTAVTELREVSASFQTIQEQVDRADLGLNPLGLTKNSIPFDIDPAQIDPPQRKTHFEQIYERAVSAMNNAIAVFNHANNSTQLLRRQSDSDADVQRNVAERENDFKNRLIEIFGYPYPEDIGPTGTYPNGYDGPDLQHAYYVDTTQLTGTTPPLTRILTLQLREFDVNSSGALTEQIRSVNYSLAADGYEMVKPPAWTGRRRAPGEIQRNLSELIQQRTRFQKALLDYDNLLAQIEGQAVLLESQYRLNRDEIIILTESLGLQESLNDKILRTHIVQLGFRAAARGSTILANALAEFLPRSVGLSTDATAPLRGAIQLAGAVVSESMTHLADAASVVEMDFQQAKESEQARTNIKLTSARSEFAVQQQLAQLEQLIRQEAGARLELYTMQEALLQAAGNYQSTLARGQRLIEERLRFRQQTAADVQAYRYKDMAFRIFRNEALQKYRAQFDHAAMYVFLAVKAYDYETNLRPDDSAKPGREFMNEIVRARTVGLIQNGLPLTGASGDGGLADPMARMSENFATLKPQLGINNPQPITLEFSLRSQLLRVVPGTNSSAIWRGALSRFRVPDLNLVTEFRRNTLFENAQPEPGLVIPFATTVSKDLNHFGWPYGTGDSRFNDEAFATKIRSITVSFRNYRITGPGGMAETVYVYLVPVGSDIMRTPRRFVGDTINFTREWKIIDQWLPLPYQLSGPNDAVLAAPGYIPVNSLASGQQPLAATRAHPKFQVWHDSLTDPITDPEFRASLLISRSVWNTQWLLVIPASSLSSNYEEGLNRFIEGGLTGGVRDLNGVSDIRLRVEAHQYSGR